MKRPRLKTLADIINASGKFRATIERGYCNTDRKISGKRLIHPGRGREGNRLIVTKHLPSKEVVLDHNAAETYRNNLEVMEWMKRNAIFI